LFFLYTVHDRVRNYPDDIGGRVPSTHQPSQTLLVDIHIVQLLHIFQYIPQSQVSNSSPSVNNEFIVDFKYMYIFLNRQIV